MLREMEKMAGNIAYSFHFPPDSIMSMDIEDMLFWQEQLNRIDKEIKAEIKRK
jgi:hypothetical protein